MKWIKISDKFPENWKNKIIRIISNGSVIDNTIFRAASDSLKSKDGAYQYDELEYLDESTTPLEPMYSEAEMLWFAGYCREHADDDAFTEELFRFWKATIIPPLPKM